MTILALFRSRFSLNSNISLVYKEMTRRSITITFQFEVCAEGKTFNVNGNELTVLDDCEGVFEVCFQPIHSKSFNTLIKNNF